MRMKTPFARLFATVVIAAILLVLPSGCDLESELQRRAARVMTELATTPTDAGNYLGRLERLEEW